MRFLILLAFLAGTQLYGQIVAGGSVGCGTVTAQASCPATSTINLHPDDTIMVAIYPGGTNNSNVYTITDSCDPGLAFVREGQSTTDSVGIWAGKVVTGGNNCQITLGTSPNVATIWLAQIYTGVASIGAFTNSAMLGSGATSTCSFATTLANAGDYSFTIFRTNLAASTPTYTTTTGTVRKVQTPGSAQTMVLIDQPAPGAGSLTATLNFAPTTGFCQTAASVPMIAGAVATTSNYYGTPPLVAGTGITITPSQTQIEISATGSPAGGSPVKVASGTYNLASETFIHNQCVLRPPSTGISAPGTIDTDVVVMSRRSTGSGWAQGRLKIDGIAFSGTISIEICNPDQTNDINPGASALPLNWMVLR